MHGLDDIAGIFEFRASCCTRGGELILKPHCSNNARAHSFACCRVNCWNDLPESTRNARSLSSFKHRVAKYHASKLLMVF